MESLNYLEIWKQTTKKLKMNIFVIYFAYKDPRVPWYVKVLAVCLVGYAFSPIDFIPDFIPVLGYLDDLIILPLGILLILKMIPKEVLELYKEKAKEKMLTGKPKNWIVASLIVLTWLILGLMFVIVLIRK